MTDVGKLESELRRLSYAQIEIELSGINSSALLRLLDSTSVRVGDTAASILARRKETDAVVDAILTESASTKIGKIRAMFVLKQFGRKYPRVIDAYVKLLHDKNPDVVSSALFGLVFFQDKKIIPLLRQAMAQRDVGHATFDLFERAISAFENEDPFIYSPGFHDAGDVWSLDKGRFGNRIG